MPLAFLNFDPEESKEQLHCFLCNAEINDICTVVTKLNFDDEKPIYVFGQPIYLGFKRRFFCQKCCPLGHGEEVWNAYWIARELEKTG